MTTDAEASSDAEEFADDRHQVEGNSHAHYSNLPPLYDSPEMQVCSRDYLPPPKDPKLRAIHDAEVARAARANARPRATRRRNTPSPPPSGDDSPGSDDGRDRQTPPTSTPRASAQNRVPNDRRDNADRRTDPVASSRRDVKVKFDNFEGSYDPNIFLEWVQTTEHTLRHCRYEPEEVVDVVTLHFRGAARTWWHRYESDRRRRNLQPVRDWDQLVHVMTRKYVPSNYREKMRYEVAAATQGTMSPQEFLAHLEDLYHKAGSVVSTGTLRDRFVAGLNESLRDRVEVLPFQDFNDLILTAQRYHEQDVRKRRQWSTSTNRYSSGSYSAPYSTNRSASATQTKTGPPRSTVPSTAPRGNSGTIC